jgi:hypothetical protein
MKNLLAEVCLVSVLIATSSFASGVKQNFIHPDKLWANAFSAPKKFKVKSVNSDLLSNNNVDLAGDFPSDCSTGCDPSCVSLAQRIVSDCAGGQPLPPSPSQGGSTRPDFASCVSTMHDYFHARTSTSADQDSADAVSYCVSGASTACATTLYTTYFHLRTSTTGDQDHNDAAHACQNGATPDCMAVVYPTYHQRSGTSATQDVNDSAAACQRYPAPPAPGTAP